MSTRTANAAAKAIAGATRAGMTTSCTRPCHCTPAVPALRERGADEAADERVRRARRQTEPPGQEVPRDRADECREDGRRVDQAGVDDPLAYGLRHGGGHERAREVGD